MATLTNALPAVRAEGSVPVRLSVALAPLARLTPVHWNWPPPRSVNVVPPMELTSKSAPKPPLKVSVTVAFVAADGPLLVSVIV